MELKNKVALIAGGARMGETVASELALKGCHVALTYRNSKSSAKKAARKVRALDRTSLVVHTDLTREESMVSVLSEIRKKFGRLDILVNMTSIYEKTPLAKLRTRHWDESLTANLKSAYLLSLKAARLMAKHGRGRIIHFSDWIARSGRPRYVDYVPYYVAKTGILGLTEVLALELAPDILVNSIAPGPILPPSGASRMEIRKVVQATPLRRWGGPREIAKAVLFLVETDFVTRECIRVDGGRHLY